MTDCRLCAVHRYRMCTRYHDVTRNRAECEHFMEIPGDRFLNSAEVQELIDSPPFVEDGNL